LFLVIILFCAQMVETSALKNAINEIDDTEID
jgi:hypothetical protein